MARIRSIKPEVWEDEEFEFISDRAKLVWFNRITQSDDSGRFLAAIPSIAASIGPRKPPSRRSIEVALRDLVDAQLIVLYEVNGGQYGWFPNWLKHQKIQRPGPPKYPAPPPEVVGRAIRDSMNRSMNDSVNGSVNDSGSHSCPDRKGREGIRIGGEGSLRGGGTEDGQRVDAPTSAPTETMTAAEHVQAVLSKIPPEENQP